MTQTTPAIATFTQTHLICDRCYAQPATSTWHGDDLRVCSDCQAQLETEYQDNLKGLGLGAQAPASYDPSTGRVQLDRPDHSAWRGRIKDDFQYDSHCPLDDALVATFISLYQQTQPDSEADWPELRQEKLAEEMVFLSQQ